MLGTRDLVRRVDECRDLAPRQASGGARRCYEEAADRYAAAAALVHQGEALERQAEQTAYLVAKHVRGGR